MMPCPPNSLGQGSTHRGGPVESMAAKPPRPYKLGFARARDSQRGIPLWTSE